MKSDEDPSDTSDGPKSGTPISQEAVDWFARRNRPSQPREDRIAFRTWLEADPQHRKAYQDVEDLWQSDIFAEALATVTPAGVTPSEHPRRAQWGRPLAAAIAASLIGGVVIGGFGDSLIAGWHRLIADHATAIGDRHNLTLADGSRITLNSASAIDVDSSPQGFRITLLRGEAFFEPAPQVDGRSFRVVADEIEVQVLGTAFHVNLASSQTQVGVLEGDVTVFIAASESPIALGPGERLSRDDSGAPQAAILDERRLAWLDGRIAFHEQPLAEVVDDLRRYHPGVILVADERLAAVPVSGNFRLDQPDVVLAALAVAVSADLVRITDRLLILR